jgi:hypothetical protein
MSVSDDCWKMGLRNNFHPLLCLNSFVSKHFINLNKKNNQFDVTQHMFCKYISGFMFHLTPSFQFQPESSDHFSEIIPVHMHEAYLVHPELPQRELYSLFFSVLLSVLCFMGAHNSLSISGQLYPLIK